MREIRLPGSEGGALVTNVPTPIRLSVSQLTSLHADQVISLIHLLLNPIHNLFFSQCRAKFGDHLPSRGSKLLSNAYMACSAATTTTSRVANSLFSLTPIRLTQASAKWGNQRERLASLS